jgi:hypothetical protein
MNFQETKSMYLEDRPQRQLEKGQEAGEKS